MRKGSHIAIFCFLFGFISSVGNSQAPGDTVKLLIPDSTVIIKKERPVRSFSFITNIPGDLARVVKYPFQKGNLKPLILLSTATTLLFLVDQPIINTAEKIFRDIGIDPAQDWTDAISIGKIDLLTVPDNFNTFFLPPG